MRPRAELTAAELAAVDEASRVLARGAVVAYPTETVYGLAVDARSAAAVARLVAMKGRDEGRGISLVVAGLDDAAPLLASPPPGEARALAARFWPGPLTIVLPASPSVVPALRGPSGGVGLRCSSDPFAAALAARFGAAITSTSANRSGEEAARSAVEVRSAFAREIARGELFVLDGGERRSSEASTVLEFSGDRATLRRAGAIDAAALRTVVDLPEEP